MLITRIRVGYGYFICSLRWCSWCFLYCQISNTSLYQPCILHLNSTTSSTPPPLLQFSLFYTHPLTPIDTPLHVCAYRNSAEAAQLLINKGANILAPNVQKNTPLHKACLHDHMEVLAMMLKARPRLNTLGKYKLTPLQTASKSGALQCVRLLLDQGADMDFHFKGTLTAQELSKDQATKQVFDQFVLDQETRKDNKTDFIQEALEKSLYLAVQTGDHQEVAKLLDLGVKPAYESAEGISVFHLAALHRLPTTLFQVMLSQDKKETIPLFPPRNKNKDSVLHYACYSNADSVPLLLDFGASIQALNQHGYPAMFEAAWTNATGALKDVLDAGMDVDARGKFGEHMTSLHVAAQAGSKDVAALLVDAGASVDAVTSQDKSTALHIAAMHDSVGVIRVLLDAQASKAALNAQMQTPYDVATSEKAKALLAVETESNYDWLLNNEAKH